MSTRFRAIQALLVILFTLILGASVGGQAIIADHTVIDDFSYLSTDTILQIYNSFQAYYTHTSHGSQIMTGLDMLVDDDPIYTPPPIQEVSDDLGHFGDTSWVPNCRTYLNSHPGCNLVMFSWCGGCSDNTEEGINIYLAKMTELETDYPGRTFIYMTGHLDGTGPDGNLYARNNQIRDYCINNDKVLFDFADIESYDPNGTWYPDGGDACEWCYDWCAAHTCLTCDGCAHSHCFNCYLKGKAWWWMMAQVIDLLDCYSTTDCNGDGLTLSWEDLSYLENFVYYDGPAPDPLAQGDINGDTYIDALDIQLYLDYFTYGISVFPEFPIPTVCNPDTVVGSCCGVVDSCLMLSRYNCHLLEGGNLGSFSSCSEVDCDTIAVGACCDSASNCYIRSEWDCQIFGNDFQGDGIDCDPSPCWLTCCELRGDINYDSSGPDISDLVYLVA